MHNSYTSDEKCGRPIIWALSIVIDTVREAHNQNAAPANWGTVLSFEQWRPLLLSSRQLQLTREYVQGTQHWLLDYL